MQFFLLYHLLENTVFSYLAVSDLAVFKAPGVRLTSKFGAKLAVAGYGLLLGLPSIMIGFYGVVTKAEKPTRFYFNYSILSSIVNAAYIVDAFVHFLPCFGGMTLDSVNAEPFECRQHSGIMLFSLAGIMGLHLAMLYPIYAYCEDLKYDAEWEQTVRATVEGEKEENDCEKQPDLPTRGMAIAAKWAALRDTPLANINGRLVGEYGAVVETARQIGGTIRGEAHLPATRLF
jgi:hypothetical protein